MAANQPRLVNTVDPASPLDIAPIAGRIGAEIRGVTLSGDLDDITVAAIKAALRRHKVIFFRDQTELTDARHEAFAARLGEPVVHPTVPAASGSRYLLELDTAEGVVASSWHTDVTFAVAYPAASILRAITVPEIGGDTLWANTATAYDDLPEPLKRLVDGLTAIHTNIYDYGNTQLSSSKSASDTEHNVLVTTGFVSTTYESEQPVVAIHPETGERTLVLGQFLKQFVGLNLADSQRLYTILQDHVTKPENTVRWRWRFGDVAIWDNRATQHRAIADFGLQRRQMRRATIAGPAAVGVDGQQGRQLKPEPTSARHAAE